MNLLRNIFLIAFITILFIPNLSYCQIGDRHQMMERLKQEVAVTDEIIMKAYEIVRSSDDETAQTILRMASERQEWARTQIQELERMFRYRLHSMAINATQKAREQARNAIAAVRRLDRHESIVVRKLERTAEILERVRQISQDHPSQSNLRDLYDSAVRSLERAREFYQQSRYRPALKLANQASSTANKILRVLGSGQSGLEKFESRQEIVGKKIEEARERLECESVSEMIQEAEQAHQKALELVEIDQVEAAYRQLKLANELISKAIRKCGGLENIDQAIERINNQLQELMLARDKFEGAGKNSFEVMLEQAKVQLELAQNNIDKNNFEAAKISLQAAHKALNQARRMIEMI